MYEPSTAAELSPDPRRGRLRLPAAGPGGAVPVVGGRSAVAEALDWLAAVGTTS